MSLESDENLISTQAEDTNDFDVKHAIIDEPTPRNVPLSGQYKQSFAYYTFRQRLPNTLNTVLNSLKQIVLNNELPSSLEEINIIVDHIEQLKQQLESNSSLIPFQGNEPDKQVWNLFIEGLPQDKCNFFKACWLYAECYMYRKLSSFFENTQTWRNYDYFGQQKLNALRLATEVMDEVAKSTKVLENNVQTFIRLLKLNLWSNRCDLSITSGQEVRPTGNLFELIDGLNTNILINDSEQIWHCLQQNASLTTNSSTMVDFICDNAGFELFTDLLLAQYLIEHRVADVVRFNLKTIPWYISDTTESDVHCTLKYLQECKSLDLQRLGNVWTKYFESGEFRLAPAEHFWTSPYEYYRMPDINPILYQQLQQSALLIFKGDLNYRKLLGDFNWDFCEKFENCLRGFCPTNLCTLRTVKGDLICDLQPGQAEELSRHKSDWMFTGEYGVIQFRGKG